MSASLQFLSLTPKTLSLHHSSSSSAAAAAPCFFNLKPLPKFVLSVSSVNIHAQSGSRFVRRVAFSSDLEETLDFSETEEEQSFSPDLKLFVGNLPFNVDSAALAGLFEQVGTVEMVEVIYDKETGRSRGFGFVTMSTQEEVEAAEQQYNGYELQGRAIRVNSGPAPPKSDSFRGQRDNSSFRGQRDNSSSFRGSRDNSSFRGSRDMSSFRGSRDDDFRGSRDSSSFRGSRDSSSFRGSRGEGSFDNTNRVYVGNLSWGVDNLALETLFSEQGRVKEAKVVYDRDSGRSRGFGFVTFGSPQEVSKAVEKLDGTDLDGRSIRVSPAEERQRPQY
ncbi:hypothetical protein ACJIZ3_021934 [Penstemon smallii]|uniref:RRM domain-containing protein n=1 Tax=Penstemon smallii TaxID=265156 RepID=A0ABD3SMU7_9LAMI